MTPVLLATLVAAVLASPTTGADDAKLSRDLKTMQGAWTYTDPDGEETRWLFDGDTLKTTVNGGNYVSKVTLDEKARPHPAADFKITEAPDDSTGQIALGIYKIEGDRLTLCIALPGRNNRPTEFKRVQDETLLFELKRAK